MYIYKKSNEMNKCICNLDEFYSNSNINSINLITIIAFLIKY